ncbi:HAD family hydrolase [Saccharothrix obliqua]|uniref:HAD family hydrolase n=1 Tax=Saccharothrix obliqua TaxID=2861747 RepID=UPI001C5F0E58|nr:HAD family hydrolase [Saccharothrix obliqua]MBW4721903.1 HAD family hydrolase [Saccharothrix obliqua]
MTHAVLFDVDGTLVDTPAGILRVFREVLAERSRPVPEADLRATIGRPLAASLASLLDLPVEHPDVADAVARTRALFTELVVPNARDLVFPGVPELLDGLRAQGRPLAAVTSKVKPSAVELLGAAGLLDRFDVLSCHGMTERGKPHPDLALLAASELGVPPERCVVVGDGVDDIRMANAAGMPAYGVDFGVASRDQLLAAGAVEVLGSVPGLVGVLSPDHQPARGK